MQALRKMRFEEAYKGWTEKRLSPREASRTSVGVTVPLGGMYSALKVTEHYSMFFVEQEGTASSFRGVREGIEQKGLFCAFYADAQGSSDRGRHYWTTPEVGGQVDNVNLTQLGRALRQLGIEQNRGVFAGKPESL